MDHNTSKIINCILHKVNNLEKNNVFPPSNIHKGINMKCGCCFSKGYHYHYINNDNNNNILKHINHENTKNICKICMKNSGDNHYHFDCNFITKNEPNKFKLCEEKIMTM